MTKLIRYPGWRSLNDLQESINDLFEPLMRAPQGESDETFVCDWAPRIDIKEDDKQYLIIADVPGVDPEKGIDIHMEDGVLVIKGEKESKKEESSKDFVRVERSRGTFMRRFNLPESIDAEKISAKSKHGVLEIVIPKTAEKSSSRKINIEQE